MSFKILNLKFNRKGFTLVELIVSVAIASVLMLGLSVFFSSTFHHLFQAETQGKNVERQFAVNEIIRNKFNALDDLVENNGDSIISLNKQDRHQLPFSYIGTADMDGKRLVFKDVMLFTKIIDPGTGSHLFGNADGVIKEAMDPDKVDKDLGIKNFAGFTKIKVTENKYDYYVAVPGENKVLHCPSVGDCSELTFDPPLRSPTDVTTNNNNLLFISDSENGRVVQYDTENGVTTVLVTDLDYPTGLAYYEKGTDEYLFIAETFGHRVRRYDFSTFLAPAVVGDGEDADCNKTARFCRLNLPTGLFADADHNALFIADSGNNRILKMSDPEPLKGTLADLPLTFELDKTYAWSKIVLSVDFTGGTGNLPSAIYKGAEQRIENVPPTLAHGNADCDLDEKLYTTDDLGSYKLQARDFLVVNDTSYELTDNPGKRVNCVKDDPDDIQDWAYPIDVSPAPAGDIQNGDVVYLGTPPVVEVELNGVQIDNGGFATIQIDTYSVKNQMVPAETDYATIRVGDGVLGTIEDKMEVIAWNEGEQGYLMDEKLGKVQLESKIIFPTGVTNAYFANAGNKKIVRFSNGNGSEVDLEPIDTNGFSRFDYTSEFSVNSLNFSLLNHDRILEMTLEAVVDETDTQTYKINAVLP